MALKCAAYSALDSDSESEGEVGEEKWRGYLDNVGNVGARFILFDLT